eukprot:scaffold49653_cov58-Phaeocystis_antarctica.AAC.3
MHEDEEAAGLGCGASWQWEGRRRSSARQALAASSSSVMRERSFDAGSSLRAFSASRGRYGPSLAPVDDAVQRNTLPTRRDSAQRTHTPGVLFAGHRECPPLLAMRRPHRVQYSSRVEDDQAAAEGLHIDRATVLDRRAVPPA